MARDRYVRKYCYTKISNTKILRTKLTRITVFTSITIYQHQELCQENRIYRGTEIYRGGFIPYFDSVYLSGSSWEYYDMWPDLRKGGTSRKTWFFKLSPFQGLKSPRLLAWFVSSLGLLLHKSNVRSYTKPPVPSGEPPKWGIKRWLLNMIDTLARRSGRGSEIAASVVGS
jgi:hypothetical protein